MKKLTLSVCALLLLPVLVFSQSNTKIETHERLVTRIDNNLYNVVFKDNAGEIAQKGQYWKIGELFKPHGLWILYVPGTKDIITKSRYDKGRQIWIETIIDGKTYTYNEDEITINRLKNRIDLLEKKLANLNNNEVLAP